MSRTRLVALLLVLGTLAIYWPVSRYGFSVFDDNDYVLENLVVQSGLTWGSIKWAFTTFYAGNWHPLTWISHMLDCQLFGTNAGMHHVVNLIFHAANSVLLLTLLLRLRISFWPSAFVAALFAWHPLHVESVAWISERKDVLSTFFALLALIFYERFAMQSKIKHSKLKIFYMLALLAFACALLSKPMFVTLPFVMLLLDFWPLERFKIQGSGFRVKNFSKLLIEKIPFFVLVAASCVVTFLAQRNGGMVASLENVPLANRFENIPLAYADYLLKIFWPAHLAVFYPLPKAISISAIAIALIILIFISVSAWRLRKTQSYFLIGWLWFLGTLVPVIGLVQVGDALIADRYAYFPSIGIFLIVALVVYDVVRKIHWLKSILTASAIFILATYLFLTHQQLNFWRNDVALFSHAVEMAPDNSALRLSLGLALENAGRENDAAREYATAVRLTPDWSRAHGALAQSLANLDRGEEALLEFREALQLEPNRISVINNYGELLSKLDRFGEAQEQFSKAMQLNPSDWRAPFLNGQMLLKENRDAEAISFFQKSLQLDPNNIYVLDFLAEVLASDENSQIRDGKTAVTLAQKANGLSGGIQPDALDVLAMAQAETGNFSDAINSAQAAIGLANAFDLTNQVSAISNRLELYEKNLPFRQSFTNAPSAR